MRRHHFFMDTQAIDERWAYIVAHLERLTYAAEGARLAAPDRRGATATGRRRGPRRDRPAVRGTE